MRLVLPLTRNKLYCRWRIFTRTKGGRIQHESNVCETIIFATRRVVRLGAEVIWTYTARDHPHPVAHSETPYTPLTYHTYMYMYYIYDDAKTMCSKMKEKKIVE